MAQVVIFAPAGEDVSAGQTALEGAGHSVEVVEATAANLLHMAIGMVEGGPSEEAAEAPITEPVEEPSEDPLAAEAPPEEPTTESVGEVYVDGEQLPAYVNTALSFPLLRVLDLTGDAKLTYKINESAFSFWKDSGARVDLDGISMKVAIGRAAKRPHIVLDEATAKHLGLL